MVSKQLLRYLIWIGFCSFVGLLLGSISNNHHEDVLLEFTLIGAVVGLLIAIMFDRTDNFLIKIGIYNEVSSWF